VAEIEAGRSGGWALRIGIVYPELLGTYGDRGNAEVLAWRAGQRGLRTELVEIAADAPLPATLDIYVLGGAEDAAQATAARLLRSPAGDGLLAVLEDGQRPVLAVCGALQLLGTTFADRDGRVTEGLGMLGLHTEAAEPRLVGEVVVRTREGQLLSGFENHGGRTWLEAGVEPLGTVVHGAGNNGVDGTEGVRRGALIATYMHGPVLVRNPFLADLVLSAALARRGIDPASLPPADEHDPAASLHRARMRAAMAGRWAQALRRVRRTAR
jgi:CobQ-like glutamine amidotransferase family enzyme